MYKLKHFLTFFPLINQRNGYKQNGLSKRVGFMNANMGLNVNMPMFAEIQELKRGKSVQSVRNQSCYVKENIP